MSPEPPTQGAAAGTQSSSEGAEVAIELKFDETVEAQDLKLRWLDLQDSRCPIGVTCIWEGQIVMSVEARRGEEAPIEIQLLLQAGVATEPGKAFESRLFLRGVDPHPKEGKTPERDEYVARLEIVTP